MTTTDAPVFTYLYLIVSTVVVGLLQRTLTGGSPSWKRHNEYNVIKHHALSTPGLTASTGSSR